MKSTFAILTLFVLFCSQTLAHEKQLKEFVPVLKNVLDASFKVDQSKGYLIQEVKKDVFVLTDGYENAPAGRFAEVVGAVRRMGVETPIHQFSPVFAAEARGIRSLCDAVPGLPVSKPEAIGLGLLKFLFEADVERGVEALLGMVRPAIEGKCDARRIEEVKHGIS